MWERMQEQETQPQATRGPAAKPPELPALDGDGLQVCDFRREVPLNGEGPGAVELRCMPMGGGLLGRRDRDLDKVRPVCNACTVPREAARRPCLYLVPFKTAREGKPRDYFACRWFYKLKPEEPATTTGWMCGGCAYWFPMPPVHMLKDLQGKARYMIQYHQDYWANPPKHEPFFGRQAPPPPTSWLRRLVDWMRWSFMP